MNNKVKRPRRRIRNYLLDRKVQLRISLIMVALSTVLTASLGYFWYAEMRKASGVIRVNALATLGEASANQLEAQLAAQDLTRLLVLAAFALLFALLIAGYGIVMTHKIAGPLFRVSRHMSDIEANRLYPLWALRKSDQLQDFYATFKSMHGALRARVETDIVLLRDVVTAVERGEDLSPRLAQLRENLDAKRASLRDAGITTQKIDRKGVS